MSQLQSMDSELCCVAIGFPIALPIILDNIMVNYHLLSVLISHNNMNIFVHEMLSFLNDADIRNIICHLTDAISNLNCLHVNIV